MKISAFQMNIEPTVEENYNKISEFLKSEKIHSDILVLPEMFTTGFAMESEKICEEHGGKTLQFLIASAAQSGTAICGSVATKVTNNSGEIKYFNSFYFVEPSGKYHTYDKHHLFRMAGEHNHYTAGNERVVVEYKGFRILLQVCYDLRFPVYSRNKQDYDMIFYVASWPTVRVAAWNKLLDARAIENQAFVVGVDRIGNFDGMDYIGGTHIINFKGEKIISAKDNVQEVISANISIDDLEKFRKVFPAYMDADKFEICK
ncbi:MAG: amidohydrolase [Rikenellaceae bacterium]